MSMAIPSALPNYTKRSNIQPSLHARTGGADIRRDHLRVQAVRGRGPFALRSQPRHRRLRQRLVVSYKPTHPNYRETVERYRCCNSNYYSGYLFIERSGISNGHPMGAIVGRGHIMDAAQDTFISSTYWTDRVGPVVRDWF